MKIEIKNIGKIKEAEIDLDKQLTVFFGPNNTGKTYISYCIYALNNVSRLMVNDYPINNLNLDLKDLLTNGYISVDLKAVFKDKRSTLKDTYINSYRKYLAQLFGDYSSNFSKSEVCLSIFNTEENFNNYLNSASSNVKSIEIKLNNNKNRIISYANESEGIIKIALGDNFDFNFKNEEKAFFLRTIKNQILSFTFHSDFNHSFFISAERIGIAVFGKELVLNRFFKTNLPQKNFDFISYSSIINDSIESQFNINSFSKMNNPNSDFSKIADEIESEILGGKISINENGDVFYGNGANILSILNSASTIKSLSSLVLYLRYFVQNYNTKVLFIDEPEINLHPENQRKIARILAELSNLGIKIYLSTHSDYILRELNNLIMLSKENINRKKLMKKLEYNENEVLKKNSVGVYCIDNGTAVPIEINETGFEAKSIDETIETQNQDANEIRWTLFED